MIGYFYKKIAQVSSCLMQRKKILPLSTEIGLKLPVEIKGKRFKK